MAPDVKIRGLDATIYERLKALAVERGCSMESLLRLIVSDAVAGDLGADVWERSGFDEVHEIAPGRQYEVWAGMRCFRILVTETIVGNDAIHWNSSIDERVDAKIDVDGVGDRVSIWAAATGVPDRLNGDTAERALLDAMRWLAVHAGVDAVSRARRSADEEATLHPGLHLVVNGFRGHLGPDAIISWKDKDVARVSMGDLTFVVSRNGDTIVVKHSIGNCSESTGGHFVGVSADSGRAIADYMRTIAQAHSDSKARRQPSQET